MGNNAYHKKDELEFFPTQEWVKEALYSMMSGKEMKVLDPCCGDGGLEYFGKYDYKLMDIEDRGLKGVELCDFLKREPKKVSIMTVQLSILLLDLQMSLSVKRLSSLMTFT